MEILPLEIEKIILDYKQQFEQFEHSKKFNKCLDQINNFSIIYYKMFGGNFLLIIKEPTELSLKSVHQHIGQNITITCENGIKIKNKILNFL